MPDTSVCTNCGLLVEDPEIHTGSYSKMQSGEHQEYQYWTCPRCGQETSWQVLEDTR